MQVTATYSEDVTVDTGERVDVVVLLLILLPLPVERRVVASSDCGPAGRTGRLAKARGSPGQWDNLGEDWLAGVGLADTHVRHGVAGALWLRGEVFILDGGRRASPEGRSESPPVRVPLMRREIHPKDF